MGMTAPDHQQAGAENCYQTPAFRENIFLVDFPVSFFVNYIAGSRGHSGNNSCSISTGFISSFSHQLIKLAWMPSNTFFCSGVSSNAVALLMVRTGNPLF